MSVRASPVGKASHWPCQALDTLLSCTATARSGLCGRKLGEGYRERRRAVERLEGKEARFLDTSNSRSAEVLITCKKHTRDGQSKLREPARIPSRVLHTPVTMIHCLVFTLFPSFGTWQFLNSCEALPGLSLFLNLLLFSSAYFIAVTQTPENWTPTFSLFL